MHAHSLVQSGLGSEVPSQVPALVMTHILSDLSSTGTLVTPTPLTTPQILEIWPSTAALKEEGTAGSTHSAPLRLPLFVFLGTQSLRLEFGQRLKLFLHAAALASLRCEN